MRFWLSKQAAPSAASPWLRPRTATAPGATGGLPASAAGPALQIIDEVYLSEGMRHARDLVLTMKAACERAAWEPPHRRPGGQHRAGVVHGNPRRGDGGEVRRLGHRRRIVAVPSLRALVENVPADCGRAVAVLDAKRGGLFASTPRARCAFKEEGAGCPHPAPDQGSPGSPSTFNEIFGPALIEAKDLGPAADPARPHSRPGRDEGRRRPGGVHPHPERTVGHPPVGCRAAGLRVAPRRPAHRPASPGTRLHPSPGGPGSVGTESPVALCLSTNNGNGSIRRLRRFPQISKTAKTRSFI